MAQAAFRMAGRALRRTPLWAPIKAVAGQLSDDRSEWLRDRPLSAHQVDRLIEEVSRAIAEALRGGPFIDERLIERHVADFVNLLPACPVDQAGGGCGFNGGVLLFVIARALRPTAVVESGVFRGFTTWVLRQALPDAALYCFDVTFANLRYRDARAVYVERDWASFSFDGVDLSNSLAFFDDHINQLLRMEQCMARGIPHAVFDDCHPAHFLKGRPAYPTAAMVMDVDRLGTAPVKWRSGDREYEYLPEIVRLTAARDRATALPLPNLCQQTGYRPSHSWFVAFKPAAAEGPI